MLRETSDLRRRQRAMYSDRGFAETNGGNRRYRTQSTRQVALGDARGGDRGLRMDGASSKDDMPVPTYIHTRTHTL